MKIVQKHVIDKTEIFYRIGSKYGIADVTEDHSLLDKNRRKIKPFDSEVRDELFDNHIDFGEPRITFHKFIDEKENTEPGN